MSVPILSTMKFNLIECHLKWIEELLELVEQSAYLKGKCRPDQYIRKLLEEEMHSQLNEYGKVSCGTVADEEEYEEDDSENLEQDDKTGVTIGQFAMRLNVVALYSYIGDLDSAKMHLEKAGHRLGQWTTLKDDHKLAFQYAIQAARLGMKAMENQNVDGNEEGFLEEVEKLEGEWLSLQCNSASKAAMVAVKACLAAALKVPAEKLLERFKEAAVLEPDCFLWHHYVYRKHRWLRRMENRISQFVPPPGPEELQACKRAYELFPDNHVAMYDYATMLKDSLWMETERIWKGKSDDAILAIDLYKKALDIATKNKSIKWQRRIKLNLAELITFGKCEEYDKEWGKVLFEKCVVDFPNSSAVLHKVGRFYHHGLFSITTPHKYKDEKLAMEFYRRALESCPRNYPCLWNYLQSLSNSRDDGKTTAMIDAIDKGLAVMKYDFQVAKLHVIRGVVQWNYGSELGKNEACDSWVFVVKNFPSFANDLYMFFSNPKHDRIYDIAFPRVGSNSNEVRVHLLKLREGVDRRWSEDDMKAIDEFSEALKTHAEQFTTNWRQVERKRNIVEGMNEVTICTPGFRLPTSTNLKLGRQSKKSEADLDDNWRRK